MGERITIDLRPSLAELVPQFLEKTDSLFNGEYTVRVHLWA
jgi:hypothetical protein